MKAIVYIDGYNLYYGSLKKSTDKWLDIQAFSRLITPKKYDLIKVRYFTAKVKPSSNKPSAATDQDVYLRAIASHCDKVQIHFGQYVRRKKSAENANPPPSTVQIYNNEEKGSDVNLAVHLVNDAFIAGIDAAILVSNDSDLVEAVRLASARSIEVFWCPPLRNSRQPSNVLKDAVNHFRPIRENTYSRCQLPASVICSATNDALIKPTDW